jgi:hypothetical protein
VPFIRRFATVWRQYRQALAYAGPVGALKNRKTVVHHECGTCLVWLTLGQVPPERGVLFRLAQFMAGNNAIDVLCQPGAFQLQV